LLVTTRSTRGHPEQTEVLTEWRFPSAAELKAQESAQRAIEVWLRDEGKEEADHKIRKTLASFAIALGVFGLVVSLSLALSEVLRMAGYEWDFSEFAKRALEKEASKPQGSAAAAVVVSLVAIVPVIALIVAAVMIGVVALHRTEPPDPSHLAAIITPTLQQVTHAQPIEGAASKPESTASEPRSYDEALSKINARLTSQGDALVRTRDSIIDSAEASSNAFKSQKTATDKLSSAFEKMEESERLAAGSASQAALGWSQVSDRSKVVTQSEQKIVANDEHIANANAAVLEKHGRILCSEKLIIGRSGHLRTNQLGATKYFRDPLAEAPGGASSLDADSSCGEIVARQPE
jgi:hypothetical protein